MIEKLKTMNKATVAALSSAVIALAGFYLGWPASVTGGVTAASSAVLVWLVPNSGPAE